MKSVKFDMVQPGQRFWTHVHNLELVEHIRLHEPAMVQKTVDSGIGPYPEWEVEWNCVELDEGRLAIIMDHVDVYVLDPNDLRHPVSHTIEYGDGTRPPIGRTCQTLEVVDQYEIKVHSLHGVGAVSLKDQIQHKYKVDQITHLKRKVIVG